jgi:hypothetical protein
MEENNPIQFVYQIQTTQGLDNKIGTMCYVVHINHKWNMILHQLNGHTIF